MIVPQPPQELVEYLKKERDKKEVKLCSYCNNKNTGKTCPNCGAELQKIPEQRKKSIFMILLSSL